MVEICHDMELIQLNLNVSQICYYRHNPFIYGFLRKWLWERFNKKHLEIMLRTKKGLYRDRDLNLYYGVVTKFYNTQSNEYEKHSYTLECIWNYDETGLWDGKNCGSCK